VPREPPEVLAEVADDEAERQEDGGDDVEIRRARIQIALRRQDAE